MARRGRRANPQLNEREIEVLKLSSEGLEASEIAQCIGVRKSAIHRRRARILAKLKARNTTHAVAIYWRDIAPRIGDNPANTLNSAKL